MNYSPLLFRLQLLDNDIEQVQKRLQEIESFFQSDHRVQDAEKKLTTAQNEKQLSFFALRTVEEQDKEIRLKISLSEHKLYGGNVKNPKELQDLQVEIQSLKKRLSVIEDTHLEKLIDYEAAEQNELIHIQELAEIQDRTITEKSLLLAEKHTLETKRSKLEIEREASTKSIPSDIYITYQDLKKTKAGKAIVQVIDNSCAHCGAAIRPAELQSIKTQNILVYCSNCGRILYTS